MTERILQQVQSTYKSEDTEEWLDIHFNRPIGYLWAKLFERMGVHPNVVTVLSIVLGVAAGIMFYYHDLAHNVVGVLLLVWANFYDSADGQLARMTGKKTHWGRMLDGFAGDLWFFTIYLCVCLRQFGERMPGGDSEWGWWIFALAVLSGLVFHARQCQLADYYRNIHLYFLKGAESELDNSKQQVEIRKETPRKGNFWWRCFLAGYIRYTRNQEQMTPRFQRMMAYIKERNGNRVTDQFRTDFRKESLPLMKYANILTFNCRALTLYVTCLLDCPWIYFVVEVTVFSLLAWYMRHRHERMCERFTIMMSQGLYDE